MLFRAILDITLLFTATIVLFFSILIFCTVFPYFLTELNKLHYLNQNTVIWLFFDVKKSSLSAETTNN